MLLKLRLVVRRKGMLLLEGIEADVADVVEASPVARMVRQELGAGHWWFKKSAKRREDSG